MKKVVQYELIKSFGVHELNHDVNYNLLIEYEDWELHGPSFVEKDEDGDLAFYQGMVRYENT